jgi:hypothetical protein
LHGIIRILFGWKDEGDYQFTVETASQSAAPGEQQVLPGEQKLGDLCIRGFGELLYEYRKNWTVKIMFLSPWEAAAGERIRCVAGAGAAPPGFIDGPLGFKKFLAALEKGRETERRIAREELGRDYRPDDFDREECNRLLAELLPGRGPEKKYGKNG